jgi:hypothetical protein
VWCRQGSRRPAAIAEGEVTPDRCARLGHAVVGSEIHLLVLDAAPQPLDERCSARRPCRPCGWRSAFDQHASGCRAGELAALIRVEDIWLTVASESVRKRRGAKRRLHPWTKSEYDRDAPRQHATAEPIEHNGQVAFSLRPVARTFCGRPRLKILVGDIRPTTVWSAPLGVHSSRGCRMATQVPHRPAPTGFFPQGEEVAHPGEASVVRCLAVTAPFSDVNRRAEFH